MAKRQAAGEAAGKAAGKAAAARKPTAAQAEKRAFEKRVIGLSSADLEERLARNEADVSEAKEDIAGFRKDLAAAQGKLTRLAREQDVLNEILDGRMRRMAGEGE